MFRLTFAPAAGLAAALALASSSPLRAQGWIEIERPPDRGLPAVTRVASRVSVVIDGRIARVEVEERFRNSGGGLAEGAYLYPLPGEAAFQNFSLWMGEREVRGEVMPADEARGVYDAIVRKRRDPALLTLAGHGLVRAQVFPIAPGETRKVVLRYTQLLDRTGDAIRFRYAMGERGPADPETIGLRVQDAAAIGTPFSPTHQIATTRAGGGLDITVQAAGGGDLELLLPLREHLVGTTVLTHAPGGENGYFMLLLSPPPATAAAAAVPRDLTLVVDVSGSMSGDKLEQARAALLQALGTLGAADRFRVIAFSSTVRRLDAGFVPATPEHLRAARAFVEGLAADGGTNIEGALDAALDSEPGEGHLGLIVFMTDGLPSIGERSPERLADRAAARRGTSRIFTVGIGHDVNTWLLDRLAAEGRGSAAYVAPQASVETAVGGLLGKLRYPALVNLRVASAPVRLTAESPAALPDLFYGEELVLFGRYEGSGSGPIIIEGDRNGRRERFSADARFAAGESGNEFIPRLWASRRVGDLTRQIRLEGATPELVAQVRDLGLRYGILTEFTSYLVQEPGELADGAMRRERALAPPPEAQSGRAAFDVASRSAALSGATNLAAAKASELAAPAGAAAAADQRRVGARLFILQRGVWTDAAQVDSLQTTTVAPFSPAYFALVRALPELVPSFRLGESVLVAGRRSNIQVAPGGVEQLEAGRLAALVRGFRGT